MPWGPYFPVSSGLENTHAHAKDDTFELVNTPLDLPCKQRCIKLEILSSWSFVPQNFIALNQGFLEFIF